jgi:hypothetical protein
MASSTGGAYDNIHDDDSLLDNDLMDADDGAYFCRIEFYRCLLRYENQFEIRTYCTHTKKDRRIIYFPLKANFYVSKLIKQPLSKPMILYIHPIPHR